MGKFYRGQNRNAPVDPESYRLYNLKRAEREKLRSEKSKEEKKNPLVWNGSTWEFQK